MGAVMLAASLMAFTFCLVMYLVSRASFQEIYT